MKRALVLLIAACGTSAAAPKLAVTSPAFAANAEIPSEYTCEGANGSPALAWSGAPAQTKVFALIVDDPDAPDPARPQRTWVHWVVPSLPATSSSLAKGATPTAGKNDWGKTEYGGPCPPIGRHRYFFKLYALDADIGKPGMTAGQLAAAMKGHVVAEGELIGTYQKKK
ncbi:MAG TPA: YbhB/YbcL family Raf kinase inhibitor-like protein [Kofleriaceae bacterium]|jgi:hypothetical protein